ncbi:MAG: hypothetical protein BWZ07_03205 [Alphaproteobacteria bacterium ADurb.BinA280]|nr:MAG: hypothetical protein BWZ07_03205 [Alphaproteobacteria bacterium ADurb.BinA280]
MRPMRGMPMPSVSVITSERVEAGDHSLCLGNRIRTRP